MLLQRYWLTQLHQKKSKISFNTASGRCCCNGVERCSTTRCASSFNTASGRCCCNTAKMVKQCMAQCFGFNTASGRCCCNRVILKIILSLSQGVSIPQAVGVVATWKNTSSLISVYMAVSIPQAVGVVAWLPLFYLRFAQVLEMCGLHRRFAPLPSRTLRRIPQAVGVVATRKGKLSKMSLCVRVSIPQAVGVVATSEAFIHVKIPKEFQYRRR